VPNLTQEGPGLKRVRQESVKGRVHDGLGKHCLLLTPVAARSGFETVEPLTAIEGDPPVEGGLTRSTVGSIGPANGRTTDPNDQP